jgi:hypothetical protein
MDASALVGVVGGYVAVALTVIGAIYALINRKRVRSNCCGNRGELSLNIDTMPANTKGQTPPPTPPLPPQRQESPLEPPV